MKNRRAPLGYGIIHVYILSLHEPKIVHDFFFVKGAIVEIMENDMNYFRINLK